VLIGRLDLFLFLPAWICVLLSGSGRLPRPLAAWLQHGATAALWSGILALQCAARVQGAYFPPEILSAALVGAALLCGFRLRPTLAGIALFTLLDLFCVWFAAVPSGQQLLDTMTVGALGCCALGGASLVEASRRRLWLARLIADLAARNDALTGLATRAEFNRRFPLIVAQGRRERRPVTLMILAIDGFRAINEQYDHLYGDLVLRAVAGEVLQCARRNTDLRARFSGGTLALVWYGTAPDVVAGVAQELLAAVRAIQLECPPSGEAPRLSLSIGALCTVPDERSTPSELLEATDTLMHRARGCGGNRLMLDRRIGGTVLNENSKLRAAATS
jgi:diguanylate cyclase (GGDEF)-like protein